MIDFTDFNHICDEWYFADTDEDQEEDQENEK